MSWSPAIIGALAVMAVLALLALAVATGRRRRRDRALELHRRSIVSLCHELRTPLNAMAGSVSLLESASREARQHAIAVIERNVRIEAALLDELLSRSNRLS